jgi:hypothetical protein
MARSKSQKTYNFVYIYCIATMIIYMYIYICIYIYIYIYIYICTLPLDNIYVSLWTLPLVTICDKHARHNIIQKLSNAPYVMLLSSPNLCKNLCITLKNQHLISKCHTCLSPKVYMPNLVTYLNRTTIFKWYVIRCGSKNRH